MAADVASRDDWIAGFERHAAALDSMALGDVQTVCDLARGKLDAIEARRLASEIGADGNSSRARKLARRGGKRSKRTARDAAKRAAAVSKNSKLADDLESGELSPDQLDAIADAAAVDETAATEDEFIDGVKAGNADQARRLANRRKHRAKTSECEHDKQRRLRRASRYKNFETGLSVLEIGGDDATIEELWNLLNAAEKRLKEADGGRDLPTSLHPRTYDQRLFDAAVQLIRGAGAGSGLGSKPSIVIQVSADSGEATVAGGGPVPDSYVQSVLANADLSVEIIDGLTRTPLWHGRNRRHASNAQFLALIARDGGCVLCGGSWIRCEAHHRMPWNAPAKGETNIDEMVLVCVSCHHHVHDNHLTLEHVDGVWRTRPALPHEIPPSRARPHEPHTLSPTRLNNPVRRQR